MFGCWGVILWQLSSRRELVWTVLQGGLDLLCVPLKVLRLNVPVLSTETVTMSAKRIKAPNTSCLYWKTNKLPVDVGIADAACEVPETAAWRPSIVKGLYSGIQRGSCGRWWALLFLLVFVIHQQRIPKVNRSTSCSIKFWLCSF